MVDWLLFCEMFDCVLGGLLWPVPDEQAFLSSFFVLQNYVINYISRSNIPLSFQVRVKFALAVNYVLQTFMLCIIFEVVFFHI